MFRIYRYAISLALAFVSFAATAQNLDPTVEVSRAYEASLVEVHKPAMDMAVPDSVQHFRLDFDYSIFDSPYKGSYEFNPYITSMRPASSVFVPKEFYLRAGAGYRLYPVVDVVWSPSFKKGYKMDVYASHRSYVGDYRTIVPFASGNEVQLVDSGADWKGYDMATDAGVSGVYDWKKGTFDYSLSYMGIHSKDYLKARSFDTANMSLGVESKPSGSFVYDVDVEYNYAFDKGVFRVMENDFSLDADLGHQFKDVHRVMFDLGVDMANYAGAQNRNTSSMHFTPHYLYEKDRWKVDAGLRIDFILAEGSPSSERQQVVYPDLHVEFAAIKNTMSLYMTAAGGTYQNTYCDIVSRNHFVDPSFFYGNGMDCTVERIKTILGLKGRIGARFSYDLKAGYASYATAIFDAMYVVPDMHTPAGIGYSSCSKAFSELNWLLDTERFRFDGNVQFAHYWGFEDVAGLFAPSALAGTSSMEYNIRKRIYFGADCSFATARRMITPMFENMSYMIPGYVDLGFSVEVVASRKLSFWARGGNLLNMTIQRVPLYAEGGINFTAGICLNL